MKEFKDCFALRFNLYKCGYIFPENVKVFSEMYGESEEYIKKCINEYEKINQASADEILNLFNTQKINPILKEKTILFLGDSLTSDRLSYEKIIEKALYCYVVDGSISSSRTIDVITCEDSLLKTLRPDIVSILIGTNDSTFSDKYNKNQFTSADEYERNINIIIEKAKESGAKIIINSIPDCDYERFNAENEFWSRSKANTDLYNSILKITAEKTGAVLNDFREDFNQNNKSILFEDDALHLTPFAHKIIAKTVMKKIYEIWL